MQTFSLNNRLGDLLKSLRDKKNWTLRQASENVGYSAAYISMLERGIHSTTGKTIKVTPEALEKFSKVYEYPYNLLMINAGYGEFEESMHEVAPTSELYMVKEDSPPYNVDQDEEYLYSLVNSIENDFDSKSYPIVTIGDRLVKLREQKQLTQQDLVDKLSLFTPKIDNFFIFRYFTLEEISKIERDEIKPDSDFIIAASGFYDVTCDWLLKGEETEYYKAQLLGYEKSSHRSTETTKLMEDVIETLTKLKDLL